MTTFIFLDTVVEDYKEDQMEGGFEESDVTFILSFD